MAKDPVRQVNVRLPVKLIDKLEAIRVVEEVTGGNGATTMQGLIEEALELLIERRRQDKDFQARRSETVKRQRELLEALE